MEQIEKMVSYREKVYREIKDSIIANKIDEKTFNERKLAKELGVSRTPVREALQMLEAEGWIVIEPWKGIRIKPITKKDFDDIFSMRILLECFALEAAIKKITEDDILELQLIYDKLCRYNPTNNISEFALADQRFHNKIVYLADNQIMNKWMEDISDIVKRITVLSMQVNERYEEALIEHGNILSAIKQRDTILAVYYMKYHLNRGSLRLAVKLFD